MVEDGRHNSTIAEAMNGPDSSVLFMEKKLRTVEWQALMLQFGAIKMSPVFYKEVNLG